MSDPARVVQVPKTGAREPRGAGFALSAGPPTASRRIVHDRSRPSQDSICWAIPKLPATLAARMFLFACWYCESNGELGEVYASNATLADWAGLTERTVRSVKKSLSESGWLEFIYKSRGKADPTGKQTDIFFVRWARVFDDANTANAERKRRRRPATRPESSPGGEATDTADAGAGEAGGLSPFGPTPKKGEAISEEGERTTANMSFIREEGSSGEEEGLSPKAGGTTSRSVTHTI